MPRVQVVLERQMRRAELLQFFGKLPRCLSRSLHSVRRSSFGRARLGAMVELSECVHTKGLARRKSA